MVIRQREERVQQALRRRQEIEEAKKSSALSGSTQVLNEVARTATRQQPDDRANQQEKQKLRYPQSSVHVMD